jgi:hypothetical protein
MVQRVSSQSSHLLEQLAPTLGDREWRLDNLYWIEDPRGIAIPFRRNEAQRLLWADLWYLNVILKARQLGFSTFILITMLDQALFYPGTSCGIIDITLDDASAKLRKLMFGYQKLPEAVREAIPLKTENSERLAWENGSEVTASVSHRGGTKQILHVSEFGKIAAKFPDKAREIKTGAFGTVHPGQFIFVESTAEGNGGAFYDMVQAAEKKQLAGKVLSEMDFRLHFFAWWQHPGYRIDPDHVVIGAELTDYFATIEGEIGQPLDARQRAWYAAKQESIGPDDMRREYPSTAKEAFLASIEGAYFKTQMSRLREQRRIGDVPHDPSRPVNTFWDIGKSDSTSIWFHQSYGNLHHLVDYYENSGEGVEFYARVLKEKAAKRGFAYGRHLGPHDLDNSHWVLPGDRSVVDVARNLGINFEVVPRITEKMQAIEAARNFLSMCSIDETHCADGIKALDNYRKQWDEKLATYKNAPLHDWACHCADALETGACGFTPEYVPPPTDRYAKPKARGSAWAA